MSVDAKLAKTLSLKLLSGLSGKSESEVKAKMKEFAADSTVICRVAGEVTGLNVKNGQFGENVAFFGHFIAVSEITGEEIESTKAFFDKAFAEQLRARFESRTQSDDSIRFSAQISVVKGNNADGYTYMAMPLRTAEVINKKAELQALIMSAPVPKKLASARK